MSPRIRLLALVVVASLAALAGCSQTTDLGVGGTSTTVRHGGTTDPLDQQALETGRQAVQQLQGIINSMLSSNDVCAILTQKDVPKNKLDPSLLTSSSARKVLADGLVAVFDHLIQIGPPVLKAPLTDEKAVFAQVLSVVEQYADDPQSSKATEQITTLIQSPGYLAAQAQLQTWVTANC